VPGRSGTAGVWADDIEVVTNDGADLAGSTAADCSRGSEQETGKNQQDNDFEKTRYGQLLACV